MTVPVLSSTTVSTLWVISRISPERIRIPCLAPRPVPTMMAVGVANPRAQGQAMTSTDVNTRSTKEKGCPAMAQMTAASSAMPMTTGTNTPATLSAVLEIGAFRPWASSTNRMMRERVESSPVRVTWTYSTPFSLTLPPMTSLSTAFSTGRLSPVSMASLTLLSPWVTVPSAGTRAPGFTSTTSPTFSWLVGTSRPVSARMAVSGDSCIRAVMAPLVFCIFRLSRNLPRDTRVSTTAADS